MTENKILILGCGAMACLFAARLSEAGHYVCLVDEWVHGIESIRNTGIQIISNNWVSHHHVEALLPDEITTKYRYAIVLVKGWQTEWASINLKKWLSDDGESLTLQNGIGNIEILESWLGESRVSAGVMTLGATLTQPGMVSAYENGEIYLKSGPGFMDLGNILQKATFNVVFENDIQPQIWGKLLINAAVNPLTALLEIPNGHLLEEPSAQVLMDLVIEEVKSLASLYQVKLPYNDPKQTVRTVLKSTSSNLSSMYQDIRRGAPTEIDRINGAVVDAAKHKGLETPINQCLTELIKAKSAFYSRR